MSAKLDRIGEERDKALRRRDEWELLRQTAQSLPSPEAVNQVVKEDATDED